jgi:hypothetical protein
MQNFFLSNRTTEKIATMAEYWARRTPSVFSPPELYITDNLNYTRLMPETSYRNKFRLAMDLFLPGCQGPFFFIQVLNDSSPEGDNILQMKLKVNHEFLKKMNCNCEKCNCYYRI